MFALAFAFAVPAFAASGINKAETQILKMLQKGTKYNEDFYQYHNAIKVYFNRDSISMSQLQADYACAQLLDLYDTYTREDAVDDAVEKSRSCVPAGAVSDVLGPAARTVGARVPVMAHTISMARAFARFNGWFLLFGLMNFFFFCCDFRTV